MLCAPLLCVPAPLPRLAMLRQGHNANTRRLEQIQQELRASDSAIVRLEGSSEDIADQYKFLQEMRGYVRDLLECFSEKVREKQLAPFLNGCCALSENLMLLDPCFRLLVKLASKCYSPKQLVLIPQISL